MKSSLVLFDIDDTLLVTDAKIGLRDPGTNELVHQLSTDQFRDWKQAGKLKNYIPDFDEFTQVDKVKQSFLNAVPAAGIHILKDAAEDPDTEIGILTARSSEEAVEAALPAFLSKQGIHIDIDPELIFAVHDPKYSFPKHTTDSELKLHIILELIKNKIFDSVFLIDDDPVHKQVIDDYCKTHHIKNVRVYSLI